MIKNSIYIERRGEVPRLIPQVTIFTGFLCILPEASFAYSYNLPSSPLFLRRFFCRYLALLFHLMIYLRNMFVPLIKTKITTFPFHLSPPGHGQIPLQSQLPNCLHSSPTHSTKPLVAQKWYFARIWMASVLPNPLSSALS